jgi:hypothetical protein
MAQEHDIEYLGSGNPFFDPQMLDMVEDRDGREPILVGDLLYVDDAGQPIRFREHPAGNLRLWTPLEASGRPPRNTYYGAGADISSGTGASNSCCTVIDLVTGQKVAEFVTGHVPPEEYARACAALCQWFIGLQPEEDGGCRLVWESNGPGRAFEKSLQRIGYWNIYFRETSIAGDRISHRKSDIPGWSSTQAGKKAMLGDYADALRSGKYVNPSRLAIGEARHFVHTKNGGVAHIAAEAEADPSGARSNHGDRCMADGLSCILLMEQAGLGADPVFQPEPPAGSVADYRRRRRNKQWNNYWGLDNDDRVTSDRGLEGTPTSPSDSAW